MKYCIFLLLGFWCGAQPLAITQLIDDFYIFTTYKDLDGYAFPSNGLYVVADEGVIMIDTPWDKSQSAPLLDSVSKKHGKRVLMSLATHFHDDRTNGLDFYNSKGIATFSTQQTRELCLKNGNPAADKIVAPGDHFKLGKHSFEVIYPGEGHSPDNVVVWFPNQKILYGGCLVKSVENASLGNLSDANLEAWAQTIKNVISRFPDPQYVIPGHFGWQGNPLQHTLQLLEKK